jgi:WD40 repeat protein
MSKAKPSEPPASEPTDPKRFRLIRELKHDRGVLACRFAGDGCRVFAGAQDEFVHHWNLAELPLVDEAVTAKPVGKKKSKTPEPALPSGPPVPKLALVGHDSWIHALALSPDGRQLAAGDFVGRLTLRSTDGTMETTQTIEAHRGSIRSVSFSRDGKLVATAGNDGAVRIWSTDDGREVLALAEHGCHVYQTAFHPDGKTLISADLKGVIREFEPPSGKLRRTLDAGALYTYSEKYTVDVGGVRGLAFNADGSQLACAGAVGDKGIAHSGNARVLLFDWNSGRLLQTFRPEKEVIATAWGVRFHPDGYIIGTGGSRTGGYVWFWRPEAETEFHLFNLSTRGPGFDLDLAPDGRTLAIAHFDGAVRLYDVQSAAS